MIIETERFLSPTEAARILDITPKWVTILAIRGDLGSVRTSLGRLIDAQDVARLKVARSNPDRPRRGRPARMQKGIVDSNEPGAEAG